MTICKIFNLFLEGTVPLKSISVLRYYFDTILSHLGTHKKNERKEKKKINHKRKISPQKIYMCKYIYIYIYMHSIFKYILLVFIVCGCDCFLILDVTVQGARPHTELYLRKVQKLRNFFLCLMNFFIFYFK